MNHLTHPHHRLWRKPCTAALAASALLAGSASAQPSPEKASEDVVTLPEFAVSTVADGGYLATESTSGTRVATQIINLPYSVQVLTEDFIKDFQLLDLDQQAPFVSGMAASGVGEKNS